MLTNKQLIEVKKFIKKVNKLKKEGSTTAAVPGFQTPRAFSGEEGGDGAEDIKRISHATGYDIKAKKTRKHSIDLHEISYKDFKTDESRSTVKKVNESIIEIGRKLREINRLLSHSSKLKTEANLDDSVLWKKTNEALVKISERMNEVANKITRIADIDKVRSGVTMDNVIKKLRSQDVEVELTEEGNLDVTRYGEKFAIDAEGTKLLDSTTGELIVDISEGSVEDAVQEIVDYLTI